MRSSEHAQNGPHSYARQNGAQAPSSYAPTPRIETMPPVLTTRAYGHQIKITRTPTPSAWIGELLHPQLQDANPHAPQHDHVDQDHQPTATHHVDQDHEIQHTNPQHENTNHQPQHQQLPPSKISHSATDGHSTGYGPASSPPTDGPYRPTLAPYRPQQAQPHPVAPPTPTATPTRQPLGLSPQDMAPAFVRVAPTLGDLLRVLTRQAQTRTTT